MRAVFTVLGLVIAGAWLYSAFRDDDASKEKQEANNKCCGGDCPSVVQRPATSRIPTEQCENLAFAFVKEHPHDHMSGGQGAFECLKGLSQADMDGYCAQICARRLWKPCPDDGMREVEQPPPRKGRKPKPPHYEQVYIEKTADECDDVLGVMTVACHL